MNDIRTKNGPIHYYPTAERDSNIASVVEYCVQIGERQPIMKSQAAWLVASDQVLVDGKPASSFTRQIPFGTWQITIRGRNHHVIVHPAIKE